MHIAIDFDGTIVKHAYPNIGDPIPGAIKWMKIWQDNGALLLLWTMRDKTHLEDAIKYCNENGIQFYGHNHNPAQSSWTKSPKCYAHKYIDDMAFGCPLVTDIDGSKYVDWEYVGPRVLIEIVNFYD
jgi:hypothetical protein